MRRLLLIAAFAAFAGMAQAQTAITYQGLLTDSNQNVSGLYDLRFRLYDAAAGGNQIGTTLCADNMQVAGGRFTVSLDFGSVYTDGRYLEIDVRTDTGQSCANAAGFTTLAGRQPLSPAPSATYSPIAGDATLFGGQSPAFYRNAANLTGTIDDSRISSNIPRLNFTSTFTAIPAFNGGTTGSAAPFTVDSTFKVTNLNADLLDGLDSAAFATASHTHDAAAITSGTLGDARLSTNIPRIAGSQTWTGSNVFSGSNTFAGDGSGLTALNASQLVSGQVPDSRLPSTVARLANANTFTAAQTLNVGSTQTALSLVGGNTQGTWFTINNSAARSWNIISSSTANAEGAGKLVFRDATANAVRMTIDTAGQVGIGTATPAGRLDVTAADPRVALRNSNDQGGGYLQQSFSTLQLGLYNPGATAWNTVPAGGFRAVLGADTTGRVGSLTNTSTTPAFRNLLDDGNGNASIQGRVNASNMPAIAFAASGTGTTTFNNDSRTMLESISVAVPGDGYLRITCTVPTLFFFSNFTNCNVFVEIKDTTGAEVLVKDMRYEMRRETPGPSDFDRLNLHAEHVMQVSAGVKQFKIRIRHSGGGACQGEPGTEVTLMYFPRSM